MLLINQTASTKYTLLDIGEKKNGRGGERGSSIKFTDLNEFMGLIVPSRLKMIYVAAVSID